MSIRNEGTLFMIFSFNNETPKEKGYVPRFAGNLAMLHAADSTPSSLEALQFESLPMFGPKSAYTSMKQPAETLNPQP